MFKNLRSKPTITGLLCIIVMASLIEDTTFRIVLLVIAALLGAVLGFDALARKNAASK